MEDAVQELALSTPSSENKKNKQTEEPKPNKGGDGKGWAKPSRSHPTPCWSQQSGTSSSEQPLLLFHVFTAGSEIG